MALLVLVSGVAVAEPPKKPVPAVSVETLTPLLFEQRLALTGSVEPTIIATLSSPAEGPVQNCCVREGDRVRAGQTLLTIGRESSVTANVAWHLVTVYMQGSPLFSRDRLGIRPLTGFPTQPG
ncbi:MAG: hypothetical protein ACUVQI_11465 [Thermochromatium sp.]